MFLNEVRYSKVRSEYVDLVLRLRKIASLKMYEDGEHEQTKIQNR
jgi:hypothetical protein